MDIILSGVSTNETGQDFVQRWQALEEKHIDLWTTERKEYLEQTELSANFKLNSLESNYNNKKIAIEQTIATVLDENIIRMKKSELETATEKFQMKTESIKRKIAKADIHTTLIANGIVIIQ